MHRWGPSWPPGATPNSVRWKANATLVLISYHASLSWLRTLPGGLMDLVVYHKADIGRPNVTFPPMAASYVLSHLREKELCGWDDTPLAAGSSKPSPTLRRLHHPVRAGTCPLGCECGKRPRSARPLLQYFSVLPNYGLQQKQPYGGSREVRATAS